MKRSLLIDIMLTLIVLVGFNFNRISRQYEGWGTLIAAITLLVWMINILISDDAFSAGKFRSVLQFIRLGAPIMSIVLALIFRKSYQNPPKPSMEQHPIVYKADSVKCSAIKYGLFHDYVDTIMRFRMNNSDWEVHNHSDTFKVVWTDSCSYFLSQGEKFIESYKIVDIIDGSIMLERFSPMNKKGFVILEKINPAKTRN